MKVAASPSPIARLSIGLIVAYQLFIQPAIKVLLLSVWGYASQCKHQPSCSQYAILQIRKHGTITGLKKGLTRIWNCR